MLAFPPDQGNGSEIAPGVAAMGLRLTLILGFLLLVAAGPPGSRLTGAEKKETKPDPKAAKGGPKFTFKEHLVPFVDQYCLRCHSPPKPKGQVNFRKLLDEATLTKERLLWENVLHNLRAKEMPPPDRKQPPAAERAAMVAYLEAQLSKLDCTQKDPGRVTIRRLNRVEYNNTIRDLVGVKFQPAKDFPADDVGYGFDNIGDVLSLPTLLMEKYLAAAEKIIETAFKSPDIRKRILIAQPAGKNHKEAARKILQNFARRAFRRPVRPFELDRLISLVELAEKNGDSFETGIQLALQAVLVSPHFLFRIEMNRVPMKPTGPVRPIDDFALASRLSYFLWSSMPDEELFKLAQRGTLRKDGNLEAQVKRMLKDGKSRALVDNFAGQWLQLRNLETVNPNTGQFPTFNDALRKAMLQETELFFTAVMKEDRSILDFIDADYTFLNERLAKHYGIAGVKGDHFRRVKLTDGNRGGVLTQASILTITSNPTRTSPVKRGKWILENILGTPPPPPPPEVPELSEDKKEVLSGSLRQRMEKHRANPSCATCHQRMDPLGFGFENFDAVGAWRTKDGKFTIDPSGTLPGGKTFRGPKELKAILKAREKEFGRCLAEKMLTYALGRGLEAFDKCAVDDIAEKLAKDRYKFTSLVLNIVKSDPFQKRRNKRGK
jgi:mono/diheme cytochrome c family protein